jgi:hypothetical protein
MDVLMDYVNQLNWVAVLAAAAASFAVGAIWYSQAVFGKQWMKGAGLSQKDVQNPDMVKTMGGGAVTTLLTAVALAVVFDVLALEGVVDGALLGGLAALGFIVTNKVMHTLFENKSTEYILITTVGDVVSLAVMGGVLGLLR